MSVEVAVTKVQIVGPKAGMSRRALKGINSEKGISLNSEYGLLSLLENHQVLVTLPTGLTFWLGYAHP